MSLKSLLLLRVLSLALIMMASQAAEAHKIQAILRVTKRRAPAAVPTVPSLNVTQYLGTWYQMYSDLVVNQTFEKNSFCVAAQYGLFPNGSISVHNTARIGGVDGTLNEIFGYANCPDSSKPGQLQVTLFGGLSNAPYWVLALGPVEHDLYQYSIVSDPFLATLFVLSRDPQDFYTRFDSKVLSQLTALGFTKFYNKPTATTQTGCTYQEDAYA
jgi:apolipoprotein D and lipocalin family protein